jgi:hypothetical protein
MADSPCRSNINASSGIKSPETSDIENMVAKMGPNVQNTLDGFSRFPSPKRGVSAGVEFAELSVDDEVAS